MKKPNVKKFLERNGKKILIGAGAAAIVAIGVLAIKKSKGSTPSREIPETDGFKILDIGEDINDGCIVWMNGCQLSDCGKLGENLIKIDRVDPKTMITMVILAKEELEL